MKTPIKSSKAIVSLLFACLILPVFATNKDNKHKDTMSIKCMLYSPELFYGIELGEKNTRDIVDTLVQEIPSYDTTSQVKLIIVSARELGFHGQTNILWEQILDSAESRGYSVCPPQVGPELYVLSQNTPGNKELLLQKVSKGRPVFIGMDRLRHQVKEQSKEGFLSSIFKHKNFFDYVFCIKANAKKNMYELGYSATNSVDQSQDFTWNSDDLFIFIKDGNGAMRRPNYCKN